MEGSYEQFENLFSDIIEKLSDEENFYKRQKFFPGIQVIYVYCHGQKDFTKIRLFLFEIQVTYDLLDSWLYFFVRPLNKKDFHYDINFVYQLTSRNDVDQKYSLEYAKEIYS